MTDYIYCKCGTDLGLQFCEMGDPNYCLQVQYGADSGTFDVPIDTALLDSLPGALPSGTYAPSKYRSMCHHAMSPYQLANGHTVYLSSVYDAPYCDTLPSVGIYFDKQWCEYATGFTYVINWHDFGLPQCDDLTFDRYVSAALGHAADSELVELGCLGAHGRTGTFLACLDIASSGYRMTPKKAIAKVRREHCEKAIENDTQAWFVRCFWARHNGKKLPKQPRMKSGPKITIVQTIKTESETK